PQGGQLLGRLDAFGHRGEAEVPAEVEDGPDDGRVARVGGEAGHELAVDLQEVGGEAALPGEGGVARPEVVDGQADAEALEALQGADPGAAGVDEGVLGDLEAEVGGVGAAAGDGRPDLDGEAGRVELAPGDVDRHRHRGDAGRLERPPGGGLGGGLGHDPGAERHD